MRGLLLGIFLCAGLGAHAITPVFDVNVFYFTDTMTYSSTDYAYKRTFYDFMVGFAVTKSKKFIVGWNYDSMSFSDNPGTETTLKITDMGPKLVYYFDKARTWSAGFTYNLITKGDYSTGTATELRGKSMRFEAGYLPMMWENVFLGAKIVYYKASFNEEITNSTAIADVTDSRTAIYPEFAMTIRFD